MSIKEGSAYVLAPDGAPKTQEPVILRMAQTTGYVPTCRVRHKERGYEAVINESAYDPEVWDRLDKPRTRVRSTEAHIRPPSRSYESREELAMMTIEHLKQLPEWGRVKDRAKLTTKEAIVNAILLAREDTGGPPSSDDDE